MMKFQSGNPKAFYYIRIIITGTEWLNDDFVTIWWILYSDIRKQVVKHEFHW